MTKEKLKRAEIRDGKIWLEGKVLKNPELLELKVIQNVFGVQHRNFVCDRDKIREKDIEDKRPEKADAYVLKEEVPELEGRALVGYDCVLYLNSNQ